MSVFAANPLQPLIDVFAAVLVFFHDTVGFGWGMSIVVLTLIVRILLLPLTLKQFKSMQSLARHQPELKRIQQKYKNDKDRQQQEMMKFYRENQINPLASCLPMIAQIPVFISLFYMLRKDLRVDICPELQVGRENNPVACNDGGAAEFLFIPNLTERATGAVLVTLIVLYVSSQLVSTLMSTVTADKTQRYIMLGLPFFFVIFVFQFPAGLLLYWITTNLWTIVQQYIVRKRLGPMRPPPDPNADDGSTPSGGAGGLLKSLGLPSREATTDSGLGGGTATATKPKPARTGPPPSPPRKKKKRSGRRR